MSRAADRMLGLILMAVAAAYAVSAARLEVPFAYDPLGPKAFPFGLSALLAVLAVVLLVRPAPGGRWPTGMLLLKVVATLAVLALYGMLFSVLGYVLASALAVLALAWLFDAGIGKACMAAIGMSLGSYVLFTYGMDISLPVGTLFGGH
ncbi:putative tricarboxylic transport membrane protein [Kushneria sinocarnis]|uniref:Putative tricarboxylic transport membrane protein n=1 Tax=Kushneria sinocarnis TaxID=595502 RepID=A0A420WUA8_9GAMM|nr:tripartite tricarboxylate transporter TctB family protein [Kushneria sinocarnis]RKQ97010.1 putative tricarboxylic transport membrane protein [Kushneria sinocarnis]